MSTLHSTRCMVFSHLEFVVFILLFSVVLVSVFLFLPSFESPLFWNTASQVCQETVIQKEQREEDFHILYTLITFLS